MNYDQIKMLKKYIAKEKKVNIFLLTIGSCFLLLTLGALFSDLRALFFVLLPLALIVFTIHCMIRNSRLLKQLASIATSKTDTVVLSHPKVAFLAVPEIRARVSHYQEYCGMTITDRRKNKYYYFFDKCMLYDKVYFKSIQEKCDRELSIQCYESTSIIRTIENDPRFLQFKYQSMFK